MNRIFIGYDSRQPVAYHVLCQSLIENSSQPLSITPLILNTLPITRRGLTDFTYSRYLVPWLCGYEGKALFMDSDMLVTQDISELFWPPMCDRAVSLVHFEDQYRYERTSLMMFNCELCTSLTPEMINNPDISPLDLVDSMGELSNVWNHLVNYKKHREDTCIAHFTQGIPAYPECRDSDYANEWHETHRRANSHVSWLEIMGDSVHAKSVLERLRAKNGNR